MDEGEEEEVEIVNEESEDYVVEAIRKWRYNYRLKRREYFIKWQNYPESDNTWEPESNLNCPQILTQYIQTLDNKQLKYLYSSKPSKLTGFQRNATYLKCVGADGPHDSDGEESDKQNKQPFYCLILFEDSDVAEEVTITEYMDYKPEDAFNFIECRLISKNSSKKKTKSTKAQESGNESQNKSKLKLKSTTKHKHNSESKLDSKVRHAKSRRQDSSSRSIFEPPQSPNPTTSNGFYF